MSGESNIELCASCGVAAPQRATTCEACTAPLVRPAPRAPSRSDGAYWVAIQCTFGCRACGQASPLDGIDLEPLATCLFCGLEQVFAAETVWLAGLAHAHAVGDLSGPDGEGRASQTPSPSVADRNPFGVLGHEHAFAEHSENGIDTINGSMVTHSVNVRAAAGHPLCTQCRAPLGAEPGAAAGTAETVCVACGDRAAYRIPEAAHLCPGFRIALTDGLRVDQRAARIVGDGKVVALECPSCGGKLPQPDSSRVATCAYCQTACLVPPRLGRVGPPPEPRTWWVLMWGPSSTRLDLTGLSPESKLALHVAARFREEAGIDVTKDPQAMKRVREACDRAAVELRNASNTEVNLPFLCADASGPKHLLVKLTRDDVAAISR